ncbi:hypothetical protein [Sphingobium chlorophenolicum]|uniref:hypothetical protein n=1 Tax=Sphingobium chlorophenolicum TaxID=46429 RepID=UPI00117D2492|nr:hypothetical protein [Sphingobium chlorophenolicum]
MLKKWRFSAPKTLVLESSSGTICSPGYVQEIQQAAGSQQISIVLRQTPSGGVRSEPSKADQKVGIADGSRSPRPTCGITTPFLNSLGGEFGDRSIFPPQIDNAMAQSDCVVAALGGWKNTFLKKGLRRCEVKGGAERLRIRYRKQDDWRAIVSRRWSWAD